MSRFTHIIYEEVENINSTIPYISGSYQLNCIYELTLTQFKPIVNYIWWMLDEYNKVLQHINHILQFFVFDKAIY